MGKDLELSGSRAASYLTLGDGDFTFSLDLVRYFALSSSEKQTQVVLTGFDTLELLLTKYKNVPSIFEEIKKQEEITPHLSVSIRHGVNAIIGEVQTSHLSPEVIEDGQNRNLESADHVLFQHPHLGTENCQLHISFLAHLFHSAANHWMKKCGGLVHVTLVEGQFERWECEEQAKKQGLKLLNKSPFAPPMNGYEGRRFTGNVYQFRRQTGKSFGNRRPKQSSSTYTFGRICDEGMYSVVVLPWQQSKNHTKIKSIENGTVVSQSMFSCQFCDKCFPEKRSWKCHIRDKHRDKIRNDNVLEPKEGKKGLKMLYTAQVDNSCMALMCPHCSSNDKSAERRLFLSKAALDAHIRAKHLALFKCVSPDWSTNKQTDKMKENKAINNSCCKEFDRCCHICGMNIGGRSFSEHLQDYIPVKETQFPCKFCLKVFREERASMQHMNFCVKRPANVTVYDSVNEDPILLDYN